MPRVRQLRLAELPTRLPQRPQEPGRALLLLGQGPMAEHHPHLPQPQACPPPPPPPPGAESDGFGLQVASLLPPKGIVLQAGAAVGLSSASCYWLQDAYRGHTSSTSPHGSQSWLDLVPKKALISDITECGSRWGGVMTHCRLAGTSLASFLRQGGGRLCPWAERV